VGTNYYVTEEVPCEHCGRGGELRHIGKSSSGWCFSLRVYPDEGINSLDDWKRFWAGKRMEDEYGKEVSEEELIECITDRDWPGRDNREPPGGCASWREFDRMNHSKPGPRGLLRHTHKSRDGEGTWDYIEGEFS